MGKEKGNRKKPHQIMLSNTGHAVSSGSSALKIEQGHDMQEHVDNDFSSVAQDSDSPSMPMGIGEVDEFGVPNGDAAHGEIGQSASTSTLASSSTLPNHSGLQGVAMLVEKLSCSDPDEREYACGGLGNIVLEANGLEALSHFNVFEKILRILQDDTLAVQMEAAGLIRNTCSSSSSTLCDWYISNGLLSIVLPLLENSINTLLPEFSNIALQDHSQERLLNLVEHLLNILWSLCELSESAIQQFNQSHVAIILAHLLAKISYLPESLALVLAQCLQTVTDDNSECIAILTADPAIFNSFIELFVTLSSNTASPATLLVVQLIASTLYNLRAGWPHERKEEILNLILQAYANALSINFEDQIIEYIQHLRSGSEKIFHDNPVHKFTSAQQVALEVLTNIFTLGGLDDEPEWEDEQTGYANDDGIGEEEENEEDSNAQHANVTLNDAENLQEQQRGKFSSETIQRLANFPLVQSIIALCAPARKDILQMLLAYPAGQSLLCAMRTVQCRAMSCLSNMLMVFPLDALLLHSGHNLERLWCMLIEVLTDIVGNLSMASEGEVSAVESATLALWGLLRESNSQSVLQLVPVTASHLELLIQIFQSSLASAEEVRVNICGIVGLCGQITTMHDSYQAIQAALLSVCACDPSLLVVAEALNGLFDAFAEANVNSYIDATFLIQKLGLTLTNLKQMLRQNKNKMDPQTYNRADEAKINLARFIKYKQSQL